MQIELREYQKQDFKALETIIRETWHYDDFSTSKTAVKLARVFLSSCLTNYTFSRVAVVDGNVAGIILANNITKHKCPLSNRLLQIKSILSLYSSKEGRNVSKIFGNVNGIDKQLLNENNKTYPAELALFCRKFFVQRKRDWKNAFSISTQLHEAGKAERILFVYRHKL